MLKRPLYTTICMLIFSCITSCVIPLTEEQLKIIDCVNKGDTLIFQAGNGNRDTLVISDKGNYLQKLNPIFGNTWYRPQNAFINYYTVGRDNNMVSSLIHIYNGRTPSAEDRILVSIKADYCFLTDTSAITETTRERLITIKNKTYKNYCILTPLCHDCSDDSSAIDSLFWSLDIGPLMYTDRSGKTWERIR